MERQKQVVHFQAKKGFTTAQSNEHQRNWTERGWECANENGRIDRTRVGLNFEVVRGGVVQPVDRTRSIPQKLRESLESREIRDPNRDCRDSPRYRTVVDFIISGSHDTLCRMAYGGQEIDYAKDADNSAVTRCPEIEQWAKDMYGVLADKFGAQVADDTTILYGGSCKASNAPELFAKPDIDGGLIGGASLKAADFKGIIDAWK